MEAIDRRAVLRLKRKVNPAGQRSLIRDPEFIRRKRPLGGMIVDGNAEHSQDCGIEPAGSRKIAHCEMQVVKETSLVVLHDFVLRREFRHQRIGKFVVAVDVLNIIVLFQSVEQFYERFPGVVAYKRRRLWAPFDSGRQRRAEFGF